MPRAAPRYFPERYRPPKVACMTLARTRDAGSGIEIGYPWESIG